MGLFQRSGLSVIVSLSRKIDKLIKRIERAQKDISGQVAGHIADHQDEYRRHVERKREIDKKIDVLVVAAKQGDKLLASLKAMK